MPQRLDDRGQLWPANRPRAFANHLEIALDLSEVELCFAQLSDTVRPAGHAWVLTTPVHLAGFAHSLTRALACYEQRYGRLPDLDGVVPSRA